MPVAERWFTAEEMAEALKKSKNNRKNKLGSFSRVKRRLQTLIDGGAEEKTLQETYSELSDAYNVLEKAHEELCLILEDEDLSAEDTYLDDPSDVLAQMKLKIDKLVLETNKKTEDESAAADKRKQFDGLLSTFKADILSFGKPSTNLSQLSSSKTISFKDMRSEVEKIESNLVKLQEERRKLMDLDPTADLTAVHENFNSLVVDEVDRCKRVALEYLKDAPSETPAPVVTGGGSTRVGGFSTTKRETVMLPAFSGDEKTAFLKYPVWKQQWDSHIVEYEDKYRATMLLNHLDEKALTQIIGLENDYNKAIEQLDKFYNDSKKIIKACLDEIRVHPNVGAFDYKALVSYKKCLVNNYTRLKLCGLEYQMSNTAMGGSRKEIFFPGGDQVERVSGKAD